MTSPTTERVRLSNLDYLRGVAAFGIMIYHYLNWWNGDFTAGSFMGRVGLYGVSIFYVLSGLTLYHVYFSKMGNSQNTRIFFVRRVFRIFPLLWLVTIAAIVLSRRMPDLSDLFLNLTGLFGFVKWDAYISTGVWSIGNELVFYALFPILVFATRWRAGFLLAGAALLAFYVYFAFWGMTPNESLGDQWSTYINPMNQAFLFFGGFAIGHLMRNVTLRPLTAWSIVVVSLVLFAFWPTGDDPITLVTGANRLVFTLICLAICAAAYKLSVQAPRPIHGPLSILGEASYSVYLIHPLIYIVVTAGFSGWLPATAQLLLAVATTLLASWACYKYFEKPFMRLGRRLSQPSIRR